MHIDTIRKSLVPYIFVINKLKNILSKKHLLMIYNSYILSRLTYLNPIWSGTSEYKIREIKILQKRALKHILKVSILFPTSSLYQFFVSFDQITEKELILLVFKIKNNLIKHNFELQAASTSHAHYTRRTSHYRVPFYTTNIRNSDILYRGVKLFNSLPSILKNETRMGVFKKKLLLHLDCPSFP